MRYRRLSERHARSSEVHVDDEAVVDASALVDFLLGTEHRRAVGEVLNRFAALHAPAHIDAEVLSALGRLHRAGMITARQAASRLDELAAAPIQRHGLVALLAGAWRRRDRFRL